MRRVLAASCLSSFILATTSCLPQATSESPLPSPIPAIDTQTPVAGDPILEGVATPVPSSATPPLLRKTPTITPIPFSRIPSNEYIVVSDWIGPGTFQGELVPVLRLISLSGQDLGVLTYGAFSPGLSGDGTLVAYLHEGIDNLSSISIRDLFEGFDRHLNLTLESAQLPFWSPSAQHIAIAANDSVIVIDTSSGHATELVDCLDLSLKLDMGIYCDVFGWSPDDKWIAYQREVDPPVPHAPGEGLRLLSGACIGEPSSCALADYLVLPTVSSFAWAPDGLAFAVSTPEGGIRIFDIGAWATTRTIPLDTPAESILWSRDGRWLAYSAKDGEEVGLISVATGAQQPIWHSDHAIAIVSWLSVPPMATQ